LYNQVQHYGAGVHRRPDGSVVNVPALVEDEDGMRLLVVDGLVPVQAWTDASAAGAVGLLRLGEDGATFTPSRQFAEHRTENRFAAPVAYELADRHWIACELGTPYLTLMQAWEDRNRGTNQFVHLHTHSEFSALDGFSTMAEIGQEIVADSQSAVAVTDHGTCAGHPALQKMATELGIKPIFGIEANFVDDRSARENVGDYRHLVIWAKDEQGLRNLWGLSTEGYRDGFYGRPRIDWDTLARHRSGLIVSTACLRGPLLEPLGRNDEQKALSNLGRLGELFGEDLFIELHANHLPEQVTGNRWLIDVARRYRVPLLASVDSHYARAEQREDHRVWLAMQTKSDVNDDTGMFAGAQDYHLMSAEEVHSALGYLPADVVQEAIANTALVASRCDVQLRPEVIKPVFSRPTVEQPDPVAHDAQRMVDEAIANWSERITARGVDEAPYLKQFAYEGQLLIEKGFPGYYLITSEYVTWAKDRGILVGPGRGSGAASLFAYLLRITEVDPIEGELLFDRFMTKGRKSLPDFDIDFPSSKSDEVIGHVQDRWGHEHVARVGSHLRIKNKSAFKDVQRALASRLPGESFAWVTLISKLIDAAEASTAGLGLSWDELMIQIGELLEPFREKMPELFQYAESFRGRLKTYGKHAAGLIIDPDHSLEDTLPMRSAGDGEPMVTQFDMEALEYLGKVKFDFLMIRNLDTVQDTIDAIREDLGQTITPYTWHEEYEDPQVYEQLAEGWTMGVFQLETALGTRTTKQLKPISRSQLADVITIGRPGPMRSGLDKVYLRRRNGEEEVTFPDSRLDGVMSRTFGVMLYQEDIMAICRVLAGYSSDEADDVRKILGKKKVELTESEGRKFVERAVANGTDRSVAVDIWAQMAEFAKYAFNLAHAYSYATLAFWLAWLKTHYPRQFLAAAMATVQKDRIPQFVAEARRLGYQVLPPDINDSGVGFAAKGLVVRYGLQSIPGIGDAAAMAILINQPYESYQDFLARKGAACNMGHIKKLVAIGAFDSLHPNRRALEARLIDDTSGVNEQCAFLHPKRLLNEVNLPCTFDWSSEPVKLGRTGKPLKNQPLPPKRCTKACRHYTVKEPTDYSGLPNYSEEEIREREVAMLGVYLSSSPFDHVPAALMIDMYTADDLSLCAHGTYPVAAIVLSARPDPKGRDFGFASFHTPSGELSTIVFSKLWVEVRPHLRKGALVFLSVIKSGDDRYRLNSLDVVPRLEKEEPHGNQEDRSVRDGVGQVRG
jgi:DNA polymerase-3 subunit alpha